MTETAVTIDGKHIGPGHPCYLIAEVGTTCMGDLSIASNLIDAAADAGADAVKFQVIDPYQDVQDDAMYRVVWGGEERMVNMREMFEQLSMTEAEWFEVRDHCNDRGVTFLATCDYVAGVEMLDRIGIAAHKIGAWDSTFRPLIEAMGKSGKPMIADMGPTTEDELRDILDWYLGVGGSTLIPLHDFHTDLHAEMNMRAIHRLRAVAGGVAGFSSPNRDNDNDFVALALGADIIEKRLILSREHQTLHAHESMEPAEFADWVQRIRNVEVALGSETIRPSGNDLAGAVKYYRSLVAATDIPAGTALTEDMLACKRPGSGLASAAIGALIGRTAATDIREGTLIAMDKLA